MLYQSDNDLFLFQYANKPLDSKFCNRFFRREEAPLVGWLVSRSVRPSVRPHDAITWKTSYVAIASRRGGGRGKLVTSLFLRLKMLLYQLMQVKSPFIYFIRNQARMTWGIQGGKRRPQAARPAGGPPLKWP
jgi:hypothetical protein